MLVVVADVGREHSFEVASVDDQDPVEGLAAYGADPPFGERVGAGRPYRCADDPDAVGAEHLVEGSCELAVAVVEQEPDWLRPVDERVGVGNRELASAAGVSSARLRPRARWWVGPAFRVSAKTIGIPG